MTNMYKAAILLLFFSGQASCGLPTVIPNLLVMEVQKSAERGYDCTLRNPTQSSWLFYSGSKEWPDFSPETWNENTGKFEARIGTSLMANYWILKPGEEVEMSLWSRNSRFRVIVHAIPRDHPTLESDSIKIVGELSNQPLQTDLRSASLHCGC